MLLTRSHLYLRYNGKLLTSLVKSPSYRPAIHNGSVHHAYFHSSNSRKEEEKKKEEQKGQGKFAAYLRTLKWTPIPLSIGFALLAYQHIRRVINRSQNPNATVVSSPEDWEVCVYRSLPLNLTSRISGWVNSVDLPPWAREPFLKWFCEKYHCDLSEAKNDDLSSYKNLSEFFRRELKRECRPICQQSPIVSPCDGTILHFGKVNGNQIEQVKGVTYSLDDFFGAKLESIVKLKEGNSLFQCVIYLAPGNYHRFHSPSDWAISSRRHFAGELLSVRPSNCRWIRGLFSLNERAVYFGSWENGFFSMAAVGATNVGSIKIYNDQELDTNNPKVKKGTVSEKTFMKPLAYLKGDPFGEFNLGSTIVLIFEAPMISKFNIVPGSKIKYGEDMFQVPRMKK